jgi:hypothetical protein
LNGQLPAVEGVFRSFDAKGGFGCRRYGVGWRCSGARGGGRMTDDPRAAGFSRFGDQGIGDPARPLPFKLIERLIKIDYVAGIANERCRRWA